MNTSKKAKSRKGIEHPNPPRSFRPDTDVEKILEDFAEQQGVSISNAINSLIRLAVVARVGLQRDFGGERNLALAFLFARIATGVENERKKPWTEDPDGLFLMLLVTAAILREFLPTDWFAEDLKKDLKPPHREGDAFVVWSELVLNVRSALDNPEQSWWPLSATTQDQEVVPVNDLVKFLASKITRRDRSGSLRGELGQMIAAQEVANLVPFVDQIGFEPIYMAQKEIEKTGRSWDELSYNDVVELVAKHRDQLAAEKTSSSSAKRKRSTKQKKGH